MKLKHEAIAETLGAEIRGGMHDMGSRLPGEHELARRFATSRTTIRLALAKLHDAELIATAPGRGSYVTYDGRPLDSQLGWGQALAHEGISLSVKVLRLALISDSELSKRLGLPAAEMIAIDRLRYIPDATAVSLERSRVPADGDLRHIPTSGLHDGSLQQTLRDAGRIPHHGEQQIEVGYLSAEESTLLGRPVGTAFLRTRRTTWTRTGDWVEHVESLLDPEHFRLHLRFGDGS